MFVSSNGSRGARNRTVNCSSAALCLILALSHSAAVGQVAPQRTANQSEIRLAGTVVDAQGQAVGGARVVLVAPVFEYARYHWLQNLLPRATVETQTSSEGTFRLAFSRTDNRFLAARDFGLVVHHPDYQVRFESVPITRMLTDLPIDVSLERAQPVRVRVLDADNNPLASVQVAVAEQGAVTIPHAVMSEYGSATDQEGWATLPNADPARLQSIYAESGAIGRQKLSATATGSGEFQVQALRVTSLQGQFQLDDGQTVPGMDQLEIVVHSRPRTDVRDMSRDYSWARVRVSADGRFSVPVISEGTLMPLVQYPAEFPYRRARSQSVTPMHISADGPNNDWTIQLDHAVELSGKVLQQETGEPIANVLIDCYTEELAPLFSDEQGEWSLWLARGQTRDMLPQPALGDFVCTRSSYARFTVQADSGEQPVEPFYLRRATTARGVVRDQQGTPVAGAVILCERKQGDFWMTSSLYSASDGSFQLAGVADGDTIRLSARSEDLATQSAIGLTVSSTVNPELVLARQTSVRFNGRVVDSNCKPVPGATVSLMKKVVGREEGYSSEVAMTEDLLPQGSFVRTDDAGRFAFPKTIDWQHRIQIQVARHGYARYCTPWINGAKRTVNDGRIELAECRLLSLPEPIQASVSVVDSQTGQPVAGTKVVILGARTGHVAGVSDQQGSLSCRVRNGLQVVAIEREGFAPLFQAVTSLDGLAPFQLQRRTPASDLPRDSVTRFTVSQLQALGKQILDLAPVPRGGESPVNRFLLYYHALATVSPAEAIQALSAPDAGIPFQDQAIPMCVTRIMDVDRRYAAQLVRASTNQEYRSGHCTALARQEQDPTVREDLIGEALIAARELGGSDYLVAMGSVAMLVWEVGDPSDAQGILREAWDNSPQLQAMSADGQPKQMVAESRYFVRAMALLDPDTSMKLITLSALPNEVERLQTEALILVADSDPEKFAELMTQFGYDHLEPSSFAWFVETYGVRNVAAIAAMARHLPDSMEKAEILIHLARRARQLADQCAPELCREALQILYRLDLSQSDENAFFHYSARTAALVGDVYRICPGLVPDFLFASMWLWSGEHGEGNDFQLISAIASGMAHWDPNVARCLVAPCFDDVSWLYNDSQYTMAYFNCGTLKAATRVDPHWTADIVRKISTTGLADDEMHRLELVCGVINELRAMIVDLHRQEPR